MNFRRLPFHFSATDPVERQRELQRRFGLPARNQMQVDIVNPVAMGTGLKDSSASSSSPRLQHRVPIFVEGYDQPVRSSVDSTSITSENKKSNVRVIPIEIEGAETLPSARHRTFSGPAELTSKQNELLPPKDDPSSVKRSMQDLSKPTKMKATTGPKVYNIPIKVEGTDTGEQSPELEKAKSPVKKDPKMNGCHVSKHVKEVKSCNKEQTAEPEVTEEQKIQININNSLKEIENVLEELKSYEAEIHEYSGTVKDKQYRYLDEMFTRCMLRLDGVDTMGNDKVRSARKSAVKKVQVCIDLLENKVSALNDAASAPVENGMQDNKDGIDEVISEVSEKDKIEDAEGTKVNDDQMVERQDTKNVMPEGNKLSKSTEVTQCTLSQGDSAECFNVMKLSEKADESKADVEMPSEESEDEMIEASCQDINSENQVHEIEMTECPSTALIKPGSTNEVILDKNAEESIEIEISRDGITQDVEIKEIHNVLNDTKEKSLNCDSS